MTQQIIDWNPVEPQKIGFRQARGQAFKCRFVFKPAPVPAAVAAGVAPMAATRAVLDNAPQLIFRPRSKGGASGYDLVVADAAAGTADVTIDGAFFNDPNGYLVELYTRDSEGRPLALIAYGQMAMTGGAFAYDGPLGPATLPTGPVGPAGARGVDGAPGPAGSPGSQWTSGTGDPTTAGVTNGDMYLDSATGNVWRWTGTTWMIA